MYQLIKRTIFENINDEIKKNIYAVLVRTPVIKLAIKHYIQATTPAHVISFKKTGRTWLNMLIGKALQLYYGIEDISPIVLAGSRNKCPGYPGVSFIHDDSAHWKRPEELVRSKLHYKYKRVVFLVRDPRDVVVSMYFEKNKRLPVHLDGEKLEYSQFADRIAPYKGSLSEFINEPVGSFDTILEFYNIWAHNRKLIDGFQLVRYEDIHQNPQKELRRVFNYLCINDINDEVLNEAVDFASFDNMRKMEAKDKLSTVKLRPANEKDKESFKTRKGKTGGYVDYLSNKEIKNLTEKMKNELDNYFGYTN